MLVKPFEDDDGSGVLRCDELRVREHKARDEKAVYAGMPCTFKGPSRGHVRLFTHVCETATKSDARMLVPNGRTHPVLWLLCLLPCSRR